MEIPSTSYWEANLDRELDDSESESSWGVEIAVPVLAIVLGLGICFGGSKY